MIDFEKIASIGKLAKLKDGIKLYSHQDRVARGKSPNAIVAHGVGSGKTLTGIAKFEYLKDRGKAAKAIVVAPAGLRKNFGDEGVGRFTDSSYNIVGNKQEISQGIAKSLDPSKTYNIMSYESFRRNPEKILKATGADTVIYDEAHRMKNDKALTTRTFKKVRPLYKNQISLTGSLVSNKPASDLYSLVDITTGGKHRLGSTEADFEKKFFKKGKVPKGLSASKAPISGFRHKHLLSKELGKVVDFADYKDLKKSADMPGKKIKSIKVPLSREQKKIYKGFLKGNKDVSKIMKMRSWDMLGSSDIKKAYNSSIQARRLMNSVGSVVPGKPYTAPKTERLLSDVQKHLGSDKRNQVALFSQMINGGMDAMEKGLQARKIPYGVFIGKGNKGSSELERQNNVSDYNAGKKKVILISGAGGEGLSLKNTTMEGMLDPHYNPERMNQMEARGVRSKGLKDRKDRRVRINRYVSTMPKTLGIIPSRYKTPDEFIYGVANRKNKQNELIQNLLRKNTKKKIRIQKIKNFLGFK